MTGYYTVSSGALPWLFYIVQHAMRHWRLDLKDLYNTPPERGNTITTKGDYMHVTIAHLSSEKNGIEYYRDEDEVFGSNENFFPDGVEEHRDDARQDDIDEIVKWLGNAATYGTEEYEGKTLHWIEVDKNKAYDLFAVYWLDFCKELKRLYSMRIDDFTKAPSDMEHSIDRVKNLFHFDWLYILDNYGVATPVSDWLRYLRNDSEPDRQRFYIHATYDGDQ